MKILSSIAFNDTGFKSQDPRDRHNYAYVHSYIIHKIEYMGSCGKWKIKYNTSIMLGKYKRGRHGKS